ncbi:hypothetical protein KAU33_13175, partial [Candidatus Dependentiae bacterium]|nr:hypothetical protein [Candidatus Dependentiae bacterium]
FFETFFGNAIKIFRNRKIERFIPLNKQGFSREQIELIFSNLVLEHGIYFVIGKEPEISYNIMTSVLGEFSAMSKKIALFNNFEYIDIEGIINLQDQFDPDKDESLPLDLIKLIRPDVICFSELKTPKQLQQAIQLSYSGKIVLAFFKERDIFHFLTSLYNLEVDTFTLKNSIKLVIHHEKVEELCSKCKRTFSPSMDYLTIFQNFKIEENDFNRKVGCKECLNFGYANLLDIYEVFNIDPFVRINMDNIDTFEKMLKEFKSQGYIGTKTKILSLIASGSIPFNSIIDIF